MYSVRKRDEADPRKIKIHDESLCRACGACLERCPQIAIGRPATSVELHPYLLTMDDPYWNSDVVSRIDLEATTGKIPVSGTGQGDPHRGFGNDGIRFGHFHIVGPAQNLLYESTADAIAIGLGRRPKYLHFEGENLKTPAPRLITLKTPLLLDAMPMEMNEGLLSSMLEAASAVGTRVTLRLEDVEKYGPKIGAGIKDQILRLTAEEAKTLLAGKPLPRILRDHPPGLVEIEVDDRLLGRMEGVRGLFPESTLFSAVITIEKGDVDSECRPSPLLRERLKALVDSPFDILCLTSDYAADQRYYLTTDGVPAVHHFLVEQKIRHRFSIVAAGGIRSAADAQKTVQRGANGIKIDWPVLLTIDPQARQKFLKGEPIEDGAEGPAVAMRLANLIRVWNVQIIEVLGASGFKDIKKTVGEENRLLIFDDLEERIYDILHSRHRTERNSQKNRERLEREFDLAGSGWRYGQLKGMIEPTDLPHRFYDVNLRPQCFRIFDRDYVWPASLIASVGRMAGGDQKTLLLRHTEEIGKLGDGFDSIGVKFQRDPDSLPEEELDGVSTALRLSQTLQLKTPFMGAGMSIGSIGPGTWRARVLATRALGTQMDTGEGGYPTVFILDSKWNLLDFTDTQVSLLAPLMEERKLISAEELTKRWAEKGKESPEYAESAGSSEEIPGFHADSVCSDCQTRRPVLCLHPA